MLDKNHSSGTKTNAKINLMDDYIADTSVFVSRKLNIPQDKAKAVIRDILTEQSEKEIIKNPIVEYYGKNQYGDSILKTKKLTTYLEGAKSGILVPSGTVYATHSEELSIHAENTENRVKLRSIAKKEGFQAEQLGNTTLANFKDKMQKAYKTGNNSITGLFDNEHNIHYRPSSHYTLTSVTASVTSIGNSIGESMVAGNRLYTNPNVVINHILSIPTNTNHSGLEKVINKYNLYIPDVADCMYLILKSTRFYWNSSIYETQIKEALESLLPIERAAFCYVNDLYHFREFNLELARSLFGRMIKKCSGLTTDVNADITKIPEDIEIVAKSILYDEMLVVSKREELISFKNDNHQVEKELMVSTSLNILNILTEIDDLVRVFFLTDTLPVNIADIKLMIRKCTVLSDTDSTCSTYQEWVQWFFRRELPKFTAEEIGLSAMVLLFNYRTLAHSLKLFSNRMNIKGKYETMLAMKNEFYWKVMIFMNKTKHYYADTAMKEGNVLRKTKLELKGSNLINSKLPASIKEKSDSYFEKINKMITDGQIINMHTLVKEIADIERGITTRLLKLDTEIMKEETINDHTSYKGGKLGSAYYHLMLWNEVFGSKYGTIDNTPVVSVKVKTLMTSKQSIRNLIGMIDDTSVRDKFNIFLDKYPKDKLETLRLPKELISNGIPKELEHVMEIRGTVEELCSTFYLILESLGFYKKPGMLLSDYY